MRRGRDLNWAFDAQRIEIEERLDVGSKFGQVDRNDSVAHLSKAKSRNLKLLLSLLNNTDDMVLWICHKRKCNKIHLNK